MFALLVKFDVLADHLDAFDNLVDVTLDGIASAEPGTVVYVSHSSGLSTERVFYEAYADEAAFQAHESMPHTTRFLAERAQHLAAAPEVLWLTSVDGVLGGRRIGDAGAGA